VEFGPHLSGLIQPTNTFDYQSQRRFTLWIGGFYSHNKAFDLLLDIWTWLLKFGPPLVFGIIWTVRCACILDYGSEFDFTGPDSRPDCIVDLYDLLVLFNQWLILYDLEEFAGLSGNWYSTGLYPSLP